MSDLLSAVELDWLAAYIFGAFLIVLFARDRLNRPVDAGSVLSRRERLVNLLVPAQLRRKSIFLRGLAFYTLCLFIVYTFATLFAESFVTVFVPEEVLEDLQNKLSAPGALSEVQATQSPSSEEKPISIFERPAWPLLVASILIGLVPGFKFLEKIEAKFRELAHDLVGVPETFNDFTDALRSAEVHRNELPPEILNPDATGRLDDILKAAESYFISRTPDGEENQDFYRRFEQHVIKLFAHEAWANGQLEWPSERVRDEFRQIETAIKPSIDAVMQDLEYLSDVSKNLQSELKEVVSRLHDEEISEDQRAVLNVRYESLLQQAHVQNKRWVAIYNRLSEVVDDICALFALFAEYADTRPGLDNPISELLRNLIDKASKDKSKHSMTDAAIIALVCTAVFAFASGYIGNLTTLVSEYSSNVYAGLLSAVIALALFAPSGLAVIYRRQSNSPNQVSWVNAFSADDIFPAKQYAAQFFRAYAVTLLCVTLWFGFQQLVWHIEQSSSLGRLDPSCALFQFLGFNPGFSEASHAQCIERLLSFGADPQSPGAMLYALIISVLGAVFAISVCLLADLVSAQRDTVFFSTGLIVASCILIFMTSYGVEELWRSLQAQSGSNVELEFYALYISMSYSIVCMATMSICLRLMRRIKQQKMSRQRKSQDSNLPSLVWNAAA